MASRFGKYGAVSRSNPEAAGVCDRGGEIRRLSELMPEMMWAGDKLVPNGFRCCRFHIDRPNEQSRPYALRADPVPVMHPRPDPAVGIIVGQIGRFKIGETRIFKAYGS